MDKQISYMILIGVHLTMHLAHPINLMSCNYYVYVNERDLKEREREREREREKRRERTVKH